MTRTGSIATIAIALSTIASTALASAPVPEIGGTGSLAALVIVGGIAAVILERRRRR